LCQDILDTTPVRDIVASPTPMTTDLVVLDLRRRADRPARNATVAAACMTSLLGISGRSADVRELESAADAGDGPATLALEMFIARAAAGIAAATVSLRRLDALVFTGGIGEHAGRVRSAIVDRLAVVGLGPIASDETGEDRVLAAAQDVGAARIDAPAILRIEAREDLIVARAVMALVHGQRASG
jgi:acetate kinase